MGVEQKTILTGLGAMLLPGLLLLPPIGDARAQGSTCAGSCHRGILSRPHMHTAVTMGDCTDCHESQAAEGARCKSGNTFTTEAIPDLCLQCHDEPATEGRHPALEDGCTVCHDPHGGNEAFNMNRGSIVAQCFDCHNEPQGSASIHPPVEDGDCTTCHNPHASPNAKLLKKPVATLCFECHDESAVLEGAGPLGSVHPPAQHGGCLNCHDPHRSANRRLLKVAQGQLCDACHGPSATHEHASSKRIDLDAGEVHGAVATDSCSDCHMPHASPNPSLLASARPELCFGCHDPFQGPVLHSAVRLGRCSGCHDPHISKQPKLLRAEGGKVCFECHSDDVTGRRSVHAPVGAFQCLACHDPHQAGNRKLLLRGPGIATCMSCHAPEGAATKKIDLKLATVHGAITRFGCTRCHDPHGTNIDTLLIEEPNALCVRCHPKQTDGRHAFSSFDGKAHPVSGVIDPLRPGKELSCISCHSPHATASPKLWYAGQQKMEICARCHDKLGTSGNRRQGMTKPPVGSQPAGLATGRGGKIGESAVQTKSSSK